MSLFSPPKVHMIPPKHPTFFTGIAATFSGGMTPPSFAIYYVIGRHGALDFARAFLPKFHCLCHWNPTFSLPKIPLSLSSEFHFFRAKNLLFCTQKNHPKHGPLFAQKVVHVSAQNVVPVLTQNMVPVSTQNVDHTPECFLKGPWWSGDRSGHLCFFCSKN